MGRRSRRGWVWKEVYTRCASLALMLTVCELTCRLRSLYSTPLHPQLQLIPLVEQSFFPAPALPAGSAALTRASESS